MITLTEEQTQQIEEALDTAYGLAESDWTEHKYAAALATIRAARAQEQAEQEPVAYAVKSQGSVFSLVSSVSVAEEIVSMLRNDCPDTTFFALYAAPVRTKDLTDDEIERALDAANVTELPEGYKNVDIEIARAVIAADREKNK